MSIAIGEARPAGGLCTSLQVFVCDLHGSARIASEECFSGAPEWQCHHTRPRCDASVADLVQLCLLCRMLNAKVIFEIGTLQGYTTLHFALNSAPDAEVFSLDLPPEGGSTRAFRTTGIDEHLIHKLGTKRQYVFDGLPAAQKIHCLYGDSATFDYAQFADKVDLFFIDGAHSNGVSKWLQQFAQNHDHDVYAIPGGSLAFMVVR